MKDAAPTPGRSLVAAGLGAAFLVMSAVMSLLLVVDHLGGLRLPGCGPGGACEQAAASFWGRVPGTDWPTSFVGLGYFLGALSAWLITVGQPGPVLRAVFRLGVLASLGFSVIILWERLTCPYCIGAHLGNFAFWITMELSWPARRRNGLALLALVSDFAIVSVVLAIVSTQVQGAINRKAEAERQETVARIIEQAREPVVETRPTTAPGGVSAVEPTAGLPAAPGSDPPGEPFTGRYLRGPKNAPIRIVVFTDFQCRDCLMIEKQLEQILSQREDVSLSIKHYPFCTDCNPSVGRSLHPNACWAARAAETAGILYGNDGFWKMHDWLFDQRGVFTTTQQLHDAIRTFGYDPSGFVEYMQKEETLRRVQADVAEGDELGLFFTPMIFINGVELKGWSASEAVIRTVEQVAATNPPPRSPVYDQPPKALTKFIQDWQQEPVRNLPPDERSWSLGEEGARVQVVVWGDYQEPNTAKADAIIRGFVALGADLRYTFRHYPFDNACNPNVETARHPFACTAARAVEAAGELGGAEAYWKMHVWLMEHQEGLTEAALAEAAAVAGTDPAVLRATMEAASWTDVIREDIFAGKRLPVLRWGWLPGLNAIPTIFIDGKYVPRWFLEGEPVLDKILEAAVTAR